MSAIWVIHYIKMWILVGIIVVFMVRVWILTKTWLNQQLFFFDFVLWGCANVINIWPPFVAPPRDRLVTSSMRWLRTKSIERDSRLLAIALPFRKTSRSEKNGEWKDEGNREKWRKNSEKGKWEGRSVLEVRKYGDDFRFRCKWDGCLNRGRMGRRRGGVRAGEISPARIWWDEKGGEMREG